MRREKGFTPLEGPRLAGTQIRIANRHPERSLFCHPEPFGFAQDKLRRGLWHRRSDLSNSQPDVSTSSRFYRDSARHDRWRAALNSKAFTLIELLVVIAIIVLLVAILVPSLQRVSRQAKAVACRANLHQWTLYFSMYTEDNNSRFFTTKSGTAWRFWWRSMHPYYRDSNDLRLCPMASKPVNPTGDSNAGTRGGKFSAWGRLPGEYRDLYGSFGLSLWVCDNSCVSPTCWHQQCWKTIFVKGAGNVPVLLDCSHPGGAPDNQDGPPEFDDIHGGITGKCWMSHFCLNRHDGYVDCLFMDSSVRKVGLKELWTLKWHREYDTANVWTRAGGVAPEDWPEWMRNFKDY